MAHTRRPPSLRHKLGEKLKPPGSVPPRSDNATNSTRLMIKTSSSGISDHSNSHGSNNSSNKSHAPLWRRLRLLHLTNCVGNVWHARRRIYLLFGIAIGMYLWIKTRSLFSKSVLLSGPTSGGANHRQFLRQAPKKETNAEEKAWKQLVEAQPEHEHVNNASQLNNENVEPT